MPRRWRRSRARGRSRLAVVDGWHDGLLDLDHAVRVYEDVMLPRAAAAARACAELADSITADTVINVDAARQHLNQRIHATVDYDP